MYFLADVNMQFVNKKTQKTIEQDFVRGSLISGYTS